MDTLRGCWIASFGPVRRIYCHGAVQHIVAAAAETSNAFVNMVAPETERPRMPGQCRRSWRGPGASWQVPVSGVATADETPLRGPSGNNGAPLALGPRYRAGGWYAPPGVDLTGFRERGWL